MENTTELLKIIEQLKKENEALKKDKSKLEVELYDTNKRLNEALLTISSLQEKVKIERTKVFLPKSEKINNIVINEAEEVIKEEKKEKKTNKGKKYNKRKFDYEKYVIETRNIEPNEKVCPKCGSKLVEASSKIRYVVEVVQPTIKVIKLVKKSYKCPICNKEDNKIYYPLSNEVFNGSILTPSLATFILYHKYELGIPCEHLASHITNSVGFTINKQNIANYIAKASNILEPIYKKMRDDLLHNKSKVIHSDELCKSLHNSSYVKYFVM